MTIELAFRGSRRLIAVGATLSSLFAVGCAASATAPAPRHRESTATARMDDEPPATDCRSGWIQADGRWVCNDPT